MDMSVEGLDDGLNADLTDPVPSAPQLEMDPSELSSTLHLVMLSAFSKTKNVA